MFKIMFNELRTQKDRSVFFVILNFIKVCFYWDYYYKKIWRFYQIRLPSIRMLSRTIFRIIGAGRLRVNDRSSPKTAILSVSTVEIRHRRQLRELYARNSRQLTWIPFFFSSRFRPHHVSFRLLAGPLSQMLRDWYDGEGVMDRHTTSRSRLPRLP